jgi:hypothetical protein
MKTKKCGNIDTCVQGEHHSAEIDVTTVLIIRLSDTLNVLDTSLVKNLKVV